TTVIGIALGPIRRLEGPAAVAADDDAGQERGAVPRAPRRAPPGAVPLQALLIGQIPLPGDVGRQAIALQDLPLLHRHPVAHGGGLAGGRPDPLPGPAPIGIGPGVDRAAEDVMDGDHGLSVTVREGTTFSAWWVPDRKSWVSVQ